MTVKVTVLWRNDQLGEKGMCMENRIALCDARGPLNDLNDKLSGEEGKQWLDGLKRFLRKENPWVAPKTFPTWKKIRVGTDRSVDSLRSALRRDGFKISDWANDILGKISVCPEEREVELVLVSGADLGQIEPESRKRIFERASEHGLERCHPEVGPQLRQQYHDQPMGEWLLIGMDPVTDSDGRPGVFNVVRRGGGSWLGTHCGDPGYLWLPGSRWVFARRK